MVDAYVTERRACKVPVSTIETRNGPWDTTAVGMPAAAPLRRYRRGRSSTALTTARTAAARPGRLRAAAAAARIPCGVQASRLSQGRVLLRPACAAPARPVRKHRNARPNPPLAPPPQA